MSERPLIVIPDDFPPVFAGTAALDALHQLGEVALFETSATSPETVIERCRDAVFVVNIRSITPFSADVLEALPLLRLISVFGAGTDNIDLAAAARLKVAIANAPGANARSVAEHAFALLLGVGRAVPAYDRDLRAGHWRHSYEGIELDGKTLGLLGLGQIGGHIARIAAGFGMQVLAWSRSADEQRAARLGVRQVALEDLLRRSDAVIVALALNEQTRGLLDAARLAAMKPGAILVNVSRGAIVDEDALIAALEAGTLRGAGLDVFATEPLPAGSPLRDLPNVVLTPHAGWATAEARARLLQSPYDNIRAYLDGHPINLVTQR